MTFTNEQIEALKAPLSQSHVKQRSQAGRALSYIEGWHAIDEANRIFGFDGWVRETMEIRPVCDAYQDATSKWRVGYMAKVRIVVQTPESKDDDTWHGCSRQILREGCGFGSGIDKDLGQAHESAIKEAETDAMKRALMTFGNPFGLALYDKEQRNVVDEKTVAKSSAPAQPARVEQADGELSPPASPSAEAAAIEEEMTGAETLQALNDVMKRRMDDIGKLSEDERANLRKVARFKGEALKKFGEAA